MVFGKLEKDLSWEVTENDLYSAQGKKIEGWKEIQNSKTGSTIHLAKCSYYPASNARLIQMAETICNATGFEKEGFVTYNGGEKVIAYLKDQQNNVIVGDECRQYMIIGNSHDGSGSFFVGATNYILRCTNQFSHIVKSMKVRHSSGIYENISQMEGMIDLYYNKINGIYSRAKEMKEKKVTSKIVNDFTLEILGLKKEEKLSTRASNNVDRLLESIESEMYDVGDNVWGLFNGATHYTTHQMNHRKPVFGNVLNAPKQVNDRAWGFCEKVMAG